jgi:hypothetical protein
VKFQLLPSGKQFLIADEVVGKGRLLIFATRLQLELLGKAQQLCMDGTFKVTPQTPTPTCSSISAASPTT